MNHGKVVSYERIKEVYAAAVSTRLVDRRSALLGGIDGGFVAGLPIERAPSDQILSDLNALNAAGKLRDGSLPLAVWLDNATVLAGMQMQAEVFARVREEVCRVPEAPRLQPPKLPLGPGRTVAGEVSVTALIAGEVSVTALPWVSYAAVAGVEAVVLGVTAAICQFEETLSCAVLRSHAAPAIALQVALVLLASLGSYGAVRVRRARATLASLAFATGCIGWLLVVEARALVLAVVSEGWSIYEDSLRPESYRLLFESHVGWGMGFLLGAALFMLLRAPSAPGSRAR
jgi:hypothetical protein